MYSHFSRFSRKCGNPAVKLESTYQKKYKYVRPWYTGKIGPLTRTTDMSYITNNTPPNNHMNRSIRSTRISCASMNLNLSRADPTHGCIYSHKIRYFFASHAISLPYKLPYSSLLLTRTICAACSSSLLTWLLILLQKLVNFKISLRFPSFNTCIRFRILSHAAVGLKNYFSGKNDIYMLEQSSNTRHSSSQTILLVERSVPMSLNFYHFYSERPERDV